MGNGVVHHTGRDDDHFSRIELQYLVFELDGEVSSDDEEQFVLMIVFMSRKSALEFRDFDEISPVQLTDDARRPMLVEFSEFFGQIDLGDHTKQIHWDGLEGQH